ncbi:hypothetical protein GLAREA_02366 [Glarea lozoyensis ATCC 20868]|uniref:C2 NT-type domain-containing protein n=1 Tax=Glarea lozoyensis (strain ATCC 20868 / MF5171) TaxID=1116229 RepID=S3DIS4_GLAL2|nr:uncharacterized protein GLAREA_02366 [Glarea lozoyensis ATCC 20868]EPE26453.1 hypothetical protein GLAREA_02366 [Glarea lozoyensis ATCC 20868]
MLSNLLVSKARKPKFDFTLRIFDLNNVPLVTGNSFVKWHLPASTSAEHRGRTTKSPILEHKVVWDYTKTLPVRLTIDKNNNLTECIIHLEIVQDFHNIGTKVERATLGTLSLNLAEYVEESEMGVAGQEDEGVVRRYLMQESKINSTLRIGICMKQLDGERNFVAPPLRTAAVFGGIAGIMAGEGEPDDLRTDMPSISKSRDQGELQDMYRRALAASWASQADELSADQCIEDIFNGGNGWKDTYTPSKNPTHLPPSTPRLSTHTQSSSHEQHSDEDRHHRRHHRSPSGSSTKSSNTIRKKSSLKTLRRHKHSHSQDTMAHLGRQVDGQTSSESSGSGSHLNERGQVGSGMRKAKEVDEFDMREDLVAWKLPDNISA